VKNLPRGHSMLAPLVSWLWSADAETLICCCCDSPEALCLSSVVQVEEVCDHGQFVPVGLAL